MNLRKMLAVFTTVITLSARGEDLSELKGIMSYADPYIKRAIDRAMTLYHNNQGVNLAQTENQLPTTEPNKILATLDVTKNYNVVAIFKTLKVKDTDEANKSAYYVKLLLIPIVSNNTHNSNVAISDFYCVTNYGSELIYGQKDIKNTRSPIADATLVRQMNNCIYIETCNISNFLDAAYPL